MRIVGGFPLGLLAFHFLPFCTSCVENSLVTSWCSFKNVCTKYRFEIWIVGGFKISVIFQFGEWMWQNVNSAVKNVKNVKNEENAFGYDLSLKMRNKTATKWNFLVAESWQEFNLGCVSSEKKKERKENQCNDRTVLRKEKKFGLHEQITKLIQSQLKCMSNWNVCFSLICSSMQRDN